MIDASIIILNYFGEKVIEKNIVSLINLNYPKNKYEIIVVDNGSKDKSKKILKKLAKKYSQIKLIFSPKNLGFAGGNNLGIKEAKGKYVILLNNDCVVDKNWLKNLIKTAEKDEKIFAVGSKIYLYPRYLYLKIKNENLPNIKKASIIKSNLINFTKDKKINFNFYYLINTLVLEIPFDFFYDQKITIELLMEKNFNKDINFEKLLPYKIKKNVKFIEKKRNAFYLEIILNNEIKNNSFIKIQNFGNLLFQDGYGRDIGAIVRYSQQFYENEVGQYNKIVERYAACGAAVLYRKSILDKIGYLDDSFFMYYEDVDICERARFCGFKTVYNPKAIVYHLHALSSKEWSPFFIFHAEKGRLLNLFYNFPPKIFFNEFFKFFFKSIGYIINGLKNPKRWKNNIQYFKICIYFILNFYWLFYRRLKRNRIFPKKTIEENYKRIKEGYWYFNQLC
jgi:GT2 family glycosyltransferase